MKAGNAKSRLSSITLVMATLVVGGCVSSMPAPVSERSWGKDVETSAANAASAEVKPGYYRVNKGDTLYSIALNHGQDHKDIVAWNGIDNPNLIDVGQMLRVAPPADQDVAGGSVEMRPIAPPIQIESRTAGTTAVDAKPAVDGAGVNKREPKGGTLPYSDAAWAEVQKPTTAETQPAPTTPAMPVTPPVTKPETASQDSAKPATAVAGDIAWSWPTTNPLLAPFSESGNKGLDFSGAAGDPVLAAASGKVTLVTNSLRGYGNLIVVKHNTTYLSVYAHNSKMLVKEGQAVGKGQKIAEIGSSDSDKPKLHFEIRREGKPVDPAKFLPPR